MRCRKCQFQNHAGRNFCEVCGSNFTHCEGPAFISSCHSHLYTPKHLVEDILTSQSAIERECKVRTVVFADVAGFTPMSGKLDRENVRHAVEKVFQSRDASGVGGDRTIWGAVNWPPHQGRGPER